VDEDCADCVHVATTGDDAQALMDSGQTPFATIQAAVAFAAGRGALPQRVCVAAGPTCGSDATYTESAGLVMADGVSVLANYSSASWQRCADSTTRLVLTTPLGVEFPPSIASTTVLDGFTLERFAAQTTAGVTVRGAEGVILSNLSIVGGPLVDESYGVNVIDGGDATVVKSNIDGGRASVTAVGVRSVGSRVAVEDNCTRYEGDRCVADCRRMDQGSWPGPDNCSIRGQSEQDDLGESIGVLLEGSPRSRIERSAVQALTRAENAPAVAVRIVGDAEGALIRASTVVATRMGLDFDQPGAAYVSSAIELSNCAGASPRVVDNPLIISEADVRSADGIVSIGDCHPVIDWNDAIIVHAFESAGARTIRAVADGGVPSRMVLANNRTIQNYYPAFPTYIRYLEIVSEGVSCEGGSCARISGNHIDGLQGYGLFASTLPETTTWGVKMTGNASALVDGNAIRGGCSMGKLAAGMEAQGPVRIVNNQITGAEDCGYQASVQSVGLRAGGGAWVSSNYIDSGGLIPDDDRRRCAITGLDAGAGTFSNNVLVATSCPCAFFGGCVHGGAGADRRSAHPVETSSSAGNSLMNNSLEGGNWLALVDGAVDLTTIDEVNALTGASDNVLACGPYAPPVRRSHQVTTFLSVPEFTDFSLRPCSTCMGAGTSSIAPVLDQHLEVRRAPPGIGPDE